MKKLIVGCSLLVLLILSGCKNVTVVAPEKDAVYPDVIPDFIVRWKQLPEEPFQYVLNGVDVSYLFLPDGDKSAIGKASDLIPFVIDGKNLFSVSSGQNVTFFYDISGPTLHITRVEGDGLLEVSGYVDDPSGVRELSVAGNAVELQPDNSFILELVASDLYEFRSQDSAGHINETDVVIPGYGIGSGISATVTAFGVNEIAAIVAEELADSDLSSLLQAVNPIFNEDAALGNEARLDVTSVTFDNPRVAMSVSSTISNRLDIHVEIPNLVINTDAQGEIFYIDWQSRGKITANRIDLDLDARVATSGGKFVVAIQSINADLNGFGFDINNFPGVLEDLLDGVVSPLVESLLEDQLRDSVPDAVADIVSGVIPAVAFNIEDTDLALLSSAEEFITVNGGLRLGLRNTVDLLTPSDLPGRTLGTVYSYQPSPILGNTTPSGATFDFAASLNVNLLNQVLLAGYQGNEFHIISDSENDAGEIERIELIPVSAPYLTLQSSSLAMGRLNLNDFTLRMLKKPPGTADFELVFGAQLNASVPFGLGVNAQQTLVLNLTLIPDFQVITVEKNAAFQLPAGFVQSVVDTSLPVLLPRLAAGVDGFEVPSLASAGISVVDIWVEPTKAYVIVAADISR